MAFLQTHRLSQSIVNVRNVALILVLTGCRLNTSIGGSSVVWKQHAQEVADFSIVYGWRCTGDFGVCSDDELRDLPEESLLYSPEKTEQKSTVRDDRPKHEIVSAALL